MAITTSDSSKLDELIERHRRLEQQRQRSPQRASVLRGLQAWQTSRLAMTYADLRSHPRLAPAVEFFLSDLYGAHDFLERDTQLMRAMPLLRRALPAAALRVLEDAIELEVITGELDQAMATELTGNGIDPARYAAAYRTVARPEARRRQIDLSLEIGAQLDRIAQRGWLALALRAAHGPAHVAGFGVLQDFLERGLAAFRHMRDARVLLEAIEAREGALMRALFAQDPCALTLLGQAAP